MIPAVRLALAGLLAALPAITPARPPGWQDIPPDLGAPSVEARNLFDRLRAHPADAGILAIRPSRERAELDAFIAWHFARAEKVADWQHGGVDVRALFAAPPGGRARWMIVTENQFGPSYVFVGDERIDSFVSPQWALVGRMGTHRNVGRLQIEVTRISPKIIVVARTGYRKRGNAACRMHAEILFYADTEVPAAEIDVTNFLGVMRINQEIDRQHLCALFEEHGPGAYFVRHFDPSGRRLPQFDDGAGPYRIIPRAPFPAAAARTTGTRR